MKSDPLKDIKASKGRELAGRRIVLCVTGSIASIDSPALARELMRHGAEVNAVMSEAAQRLLKPDMLEWATGNPVVRSLTGKTEHVRLASGGTRADLVLVAPCTANTISKIALGIDDTPVTTFASMALGNGIPVIICPAAHEPMYRNDAVVENLAKLRGRGVVVVEPRMEEGKAKVADNESIVASVMKTLAKKDMNGLNVLVTGGPTAEFIDPVRVITNLSSGKMGLSLAKEAWRRGANVTYVFGGQLPTPPFIEACRVVTTEEMRERVVTAVRGKCDIVIASAAPADFAPEARSAKKIPTKKGRFSLPLRPTRKILDAARRARPDLFMVAFKAETVESMKVLAARARRFMRDKGLQMVVANNASSEIFGSDYDEVLIISRARKVHVNRDTKENVSRKIIDEVVRAYRRR